MTESTIFEKNLKALEKNNPELVEELRATDAEGIELEQAKNGEYTFKYNDLYFHSRYDPAKEALAQFEDIAEKKADWVILFGLGCGHLFSALVQEKKDAEFGARIIVFEPSMEILMGVLQKIDLSGSFNQASVYIFHDVILVETMMSERVEGIEDILGYQTTPYKQSFPSELVDFMTRVENARVISKVYIRTDITSRLLWLENYFANIESFFEYPDVSVLLKKFQGVPMIVVGAGPSLAKNAHLLKEIKGKALIVAAASAYMPLLKYGIVPDLVIVAEKADIPGHFAGGEEDAQIRLVLSDVVHPNMLRRKVKGKFTFISSFMCLSARHAKFWGDGYYPDIGGSVTTTATGLGVDFGCDPVVLVGQDLAFGKGGTHVEGSAYSDQSLDFNDDGTVRLHERYANSEERVFSDHKVLWLKGVNEKRVASKYDWVTFHSWFEEYMRGNNKRDNPTKIINATEGGAYIEGMEHTTLKDVMGRYISNNRPIEEILSKADNEKRNVDFEGLLGEYSDINSSLKKIKEMATAIIKDANKAMKIFDKSGLTHEMSGSVARVQSKEKKLFDESVNVVFMWETVVEYTYELKEYLREDVEKGSSEQVRKDLESIIVTYKNIRDAAARFIPIMIKSAEIIKENRAKVSITSGGCDG